jgi:hypothetical protein
MVIRIETIGSIWKFWKEHGDERPGSGCAVRHVDPRTDAEDQVSPTTWKAYPADQHAEDQVWMNK